jgi:hypothetical protein
MATEYVLGPAIESVVEPGAVEPTTTGRVGVVFHTTPTTPGGNVHVVLAPSTNQTDVRPQSVHAVYCMHPAQVPAPADRTAQWFLDSPFPRASSPVPQPPLPADSVITIHVPGVQPGIHLVQTILEYGS